MSFYSFYPPSSGGSSANASVGPNNDPIPGSSTLVAGENPSGDLQPLQTNASGDLLVEVNAETSGLATAANQVLEIAQLTTLNGKVTAVNTGAVVVSSSVLPTGAATETTLAAMSNKIQSSDVSEDYDYRAFTYVSTSQKIDTIVYKTGGSGGSVVATQTFGYDGSDRLTSITKT